MASCEHFMATDVEWDPTGRYGHHRGDERAPDGERLPRLDLQRDGCCTSTPGSAFTSFCGARAPSLLFEGEGGGAIVKNLKKYSKRFDELDESIRGQQDSHLAAQKQEVLDAWNRWIEAKKAEVKAPEYQAKVAPMAREVSGVEARGGDADVVEEQVEVEEIFRGRTRRSPTPRDEIRRPRVLLRGRRRASDAPLNSDLARWLLDLGGRSRPMLRNPLLLAVIVQTRPSLSLSRLARLSASVARRSFHLRLASSSTIRLVSSSPQQPAARSASSPSSAAHAEPSLNPREIVRVRLGSSSSPTDSPEESPPAAVGLRAVRSTFDPRPRRLLRCRPVRRLAEPDRGRGRVTPSRCARPCCTRCAPPRAGSRPRTAR